MLPHLQTHPQTSNGMQQPKRTFGARAAETRKVGAAQKQGLVHVRNDQSEVALTLSGSYPPSSTCPGVSNVNINEFNEGSNQIVSCTSIDDEESIINLSHSGVPKKKEQLNEERRGKNEMPEGVEQTKIDMALRSPVMKS